MNWRTVLQWLLLLLGLLVHTTTLSEWLSQEAAIMGTRVRVELWHDDTLAGSAAIQAVLSEFRRIDRLMSPYQLASELTRLNQDAAKQAVSVSDELFMLLQTSLEISRLTDGAFDITFASVGHQYDYRKGITPTDEQLVHDLPNIDFKHILLNPTDHGVSYKQSGVRIDLGGIAKGYAVDQGIKLLQQRNIKQALITAGGDSRILGDRRGRPWHIGIRAPRARQEMVALLPLVNTAISTSGDYERFFEAEGIRHHHIISPVTGRSANQVQSVTIIGPDATHTDALSTSVFVMGPVAGLTLINSLPELEAVIIDNHGEMLYSDGLQDVKH